MAPSRSTRSRIAAYLFGLGAVIAALAPAFRDANADSYPLSTYPMFARPLGKPRILFLESVDERRRIRAVPPELVANDEVMQSAKRIRRAAREGPEALKRLCQEVAKSVGKQRRRPKLIELRIVEARFDPIAYFSNGAQPDERSVLMTCKVRAR
jgi:hypothetical protein